MPQKQKLKRVVDAYDRLKTDILTSKLSPDFQAPEPEIADMLGMSRTPVREALIRLQSEGLVDLVPRHGARVRSLGINDIQELHDILASLEAEVCHQLALRGVTLAEIEELNSFLSPISEAEAKGDFESWLDSDSRLRVRLFQMRGNQRLEHIGRVLLDQLHRGRMTLLTLAKQPDCSVSELETVLAAVYSGDAQRASKLAAGYRRSACKVLIERFGQAKLLSV